MIYHPTATVTPSRLFGWHIGFGATCDECIPVSREYGAWRPTRGMAEARARRFLTREAHKQAREDSGYEVHVR